MLGGGFRADETVSGTSGLQPQQGYHMRGSYPSTGSGTPPTEVTDGTTNPTAWTALEQAGGAPASGSADLHAFALCAPSGVQVPAGAIGGLLLTGLVALVFVGYQLSRRPARRQAAIS